MRKAARPKTHKATGTGRQCHYPTSHLSAPVQRKCQQCLSDEPSEWGLTGVFGVLRAHDANLTVHALGVPDPSPSSHAEMERSKQSVVGCCGMLLTGYWPLRPPLCLSDGGGNGLMRWGHKGSPALPQRVVREPSSNTPRIPRTKDWMGMGHGPIMVLRRGEESKRG